MTDNKCQHDRINQPSYGGRYCYDCGYIFKPGELAEWESAETTPLSEKEKKVCFIPKPQIFGENADIHNLRTMEVVENLFQKEDVKQALKDFKEDLTKTIDVYGIADVELAEQLNFYLKRHFGSLADE